MLRHPDSPAPTPFSMRPCTSVDSRVICSALRDKAVRAVGSRESSASALRSASSCPLLVSTPKPVSAPSGSGLGASEGEPEWHDQRPRMRFPRSVARDARGDKNLASGEFEDEEASDLDEPPRAELEEWLVELDKEGLSRGGGHAACARALSIARRRVHICCRFSRHLQ